MASSIVVEDEDALLEILLRLPSNSLVRFRSVCKSWNQLISSDPLLTSLHLQRNHFRIAIILDTSPVTTYSFDPENLATTHHHHHHQFNAFNDNIGSCDGLICTKLNRGSISVWNPSTRTHTTFPHHGGRSNHRGSLSSYGFFHDPKCGDYKLLKITTTNGSDSSQSVLYSTCDGVGRSIGDIPYRLVSKNAGVVANGAVHWLVARSSSSQRVILAFYPARQVFEEIPPPCDMEDYLDKAELAQLSGWLSLVFTLSVKCLVWLMQEYGTVESWLVQFVVPTDNIFLERPLRIVPLYFSKTGDRIFLQINNKKLFTYDRRKKNFVNIRIKYPKTGLHLMGNASNGIFWAKPVEDSIVDIRNSHGGGQRFLQNKPESPYQCLIRTNGPQVLQYLGAMQRMYVMYVEIIRNTPETERTVNQIA